MASAITHVAIKDFLVFKGGFTADFCSGVNVLIGENGSGKTSLMRCVYGFQDEVVKITQDLYAMAEMKAYDLFWSNDHADTPPKREFHLEKEWGEACLVVDVARMDVLDKLHFVYIPEKDILEHAKGLLTFIEQKQTGFGKIYRDVLIAAQDVPTKTQTETQRTIGQKIVEIIGGDVRWDKGEGSFYTLRTDGKRIPFANEASGFKKLGFLGLLVSSGQLNPGSVLFWDEPENSLNPELVPTLADILLELQRGGVQIFIATHSYDIARWFELNKTADNTLRYFNLRKTDDGIVAEVADDYVSLPNSVIEDAGDLLLKRVAEIAAESAGVKWE
jgi:energy-coupling factor transporter ATP-binding protein EcfA2